ncbi:DUF1917-domain-containing protein [Sarocladium strictum]
MDLGDSDFYGSSETVDALETRVEQFDVPSWAAGHAAHPGRPPHQSSKITGSNLHNPYAGVPYAWQLTESLDDFLTRLPPATTPQSLTLPWIFICNPYIPRVAKGEGDSQTITLNEDEAPEEPGSRPRVVAEGGLERLQLMTEFMNGLRKRGGSSTAVEKDINKERKQAVDDILNLAHAARVRAGKWMLFCPPGEVNDIWSAVARATANNELGIAAKVAPKSEDEDPRKDRLVCVYTADFRDREDVGRVLQRLRELKLVEAKGRPIYYKPDAFTYIGIASGNPWELRSSIYSSKEF